MHQIRFRLGLRPRPRWAAYSAPPDPLAEFLRGRFAAGRRKGTEREDRGYSPQTSIPGAATGYLVMLLVPLADLGAKT